MTPITSPLPAAPPAARPLGAALARDAEAAGAYPAKSVLGLIGRTPAVVLRRLAGGAPAADIVAKLEGSNPGGSVKDRTALGMVLDARERGLLAPGRGLVEPTAGNTGIGLALVGAALGHPVTIVMPARYCRRKAETAAALGAEVVLVEGPAAGMRECRDVARREAERRSAVVLDQFENAANAAVHEITTGPEILEQCAGALDVLVLGVGTGGTLTGVVRAVRRRLPEVRAVAVESQGSVLGGRTPRPTRVEGIGSTFVPTVLDRSLVDEVVTVSDEDAFATCALVASREGLRVGPSGGAILAAALRVALRLGPGRRVATIVPDGADRYRRATD